MSVDGGEVRGGNSSNLVDGVRSRRMDGGRPYDSNLFLGFFYLSKVLVFE